MTLAGLAPLIKPGLTDPHADWPYAIAVFGFFGGAAILTAISFRGADRPHSAEPISRVPAEIWVRKIGVVASSVVFAGLITVLAQFASGLLVWKEVAMHNILEPILLLAIIVCSTGFWTMLTRSIIGGLLLTAAAQIVLYLLLVLFANLLNRMAPVAPGETNLVHTPEVHAALSWFVCGFGLSYAALMLWLGRKRFAHSATEGMMHSD